MSSIAPRQTASFSKLPPCLQASTLYFFCLLCFLESALLQRSVLKMWCRISDFTLEKLSVPCALWLPCFYPLPNGRYNKASALAWSFCPEFKARSCKQVVKMLFLFSYELVTEGLRQSNLPLCWETPLENTVWTNYKRKNKMSFWLMPNNTSYHRTWGDSHC